MASTVLLAAAASPPSQRTSLTADGVPQMLWKLLVQRISDKAPGVRTKSLGCVAVLLVKLHAEPGHRMLHQVQMPVPVPAAAAVSPMLPPPPGSMPPPPPAVLDASKGGGGGPVGSPQAVAERGASPGVQVEAALTLTLTLTLILALALVLTLTCPARWSAGSRSLVSSAGDT